MGARYKGAAEHNARRPRRRLSFFHAGPAPKGAGPRSGANAAPAAGHIDLLRRRERPLEAVHVDRLGAQVPGAAAQPWQRHFGLVDEYVDIGLAEVRRARHLEPVALSRQAGLPAECHVAGVGGGGRAARVGAREQGPGRGGAVIRCLIL